MERKVLKQEVLVVLDQKRHVPAKKAQMFRNAERNGIDLSDAEAKDFLALITSNDEPATVIKDA